MSPGTVTDNGKRYLKRLDELYKTVRAWMKESDPKADLIEESTDVRMGELESYSAPELTIRRPNAEDVRLIPRGHHTIAAQGRVDVKSRLGSETLVYMPEGGFSIKTTIHEGGNVVEEHERRVTPDVAEGWVWVGDIKERSFHTLDQDTFFKLLVSLGQ